jgi:hypothetical protein
MKLILWQWLTNEYEKFCLDHGPPDAQQPQEYIGWHHICCLNNMVSVRVDIHELFDAFEIGIDFNVRFGQRRRQKCLNQAATGLEVE